MVFCDTQEEKEQAIYDNNLSLSFTEKRIWDMWRRWRVSDRKLYPWDYMTKGVVYADDVIDLEALDNIVTKLEKEHDTYAKGLEESKANRPNPNVRSLI